MSKNNSGKTILITLIAIFAVITLIGVGFGANALGFRNKVVTLKNKIEGQSEDNKVAYDTMWKRVNELTQVTELQKDHIKDVFTAVMSSRDYDIENFIGALQEDNPQIDSSVYTTLQREISAGREKFANKQTTIIDIVREYNTLVETKFIVNMLFSFEKLNIADYTVTSSKTENVFESGLDDEPMKIGGGN